MDYESLLIEAENLDLVVKEMPLNGNQGRIKGNRVAIRKDIPTVEKACTLVEELGHYHTSSGDILNQCNVCNRKQEHRARLWGYNKKIGLVGIIDAYEHKCFSLYDMAQHLDVTEKFLKDALDCYRKKYGMYAEIDNHIIYFEPCFGVIKLF